MSIEDRVKAALDAWHAGSINHALHLELAELVAEFDKVLGKTPPPIPPAPVEPIAPADPSVK